MAVLGAALVTIYKPKPAVSHVNVPAVENHEGMNQ
jgi:hypothetical protein